MADEDTSLYDSISKLKISPKSTVNAVISDENIPVSLNPFTAISKRRRWPKSSELTCQCSKQNLFLTNLKSKSKFKHTSKKLIRDPVFKFVSKYSLDANNTTVKTYVKPSVHIKNESNAVIGDTSEHFSNSSLVHQDFKSLLDGCERLSIDNKYETDSFRSVRNGSGKANKSGTKQHTGNSNSTASCSQQAIARMGITPPCDVTIDELASYFETFVHIPKKMSSMAEMMYI